MLIVHLFLDLQLPYVSSLKGRRKISGSIKERLKRKNLSVADVSGEYVKEAALQICFLAKNEPEAKKSMESIERLLERFWSDIEYNISYEFI